MSLLPEQEMDQADLDEECISTDEIRIGIYDSSSDGKSVGQADWQSLAILELDEMLQQYFSGQNVYVAFDMSLSCEEGNPKAVCSPDCMVIFNTTCHARRGSRLSQSVAIRARCFRIRQPKQETFCHERERF